METTTHRRTRPRSRPDHEAITTTAMPPGPGVGGPLPDAAGDFLAVAALNEVARLAGEATDRLDAGDFAGATSSLHALSAHSGLAAEHVGRRWAAESVGAAVGLPSSKPANAAERPGFYL